jgi:hypothetical protein
VTATTSIRPAVKSALLTALQLKPELEGVQLSYGWPGDALEREHIWIGNVTGTVRIALLSTGRKYRDDKFNVSVFVQAGLIGGTEAEAEERATQLLAALEDVLADDPSIGEVDGLIDAELTTVDGPHTMLTKEGAVTMYVCEINCHGRYA